MIVNGVYSIEEYPNENKVVITLPQTASTIRSTIGAVSNRKARLTDNELYTLVTLAKMMYEETE